MTDRYEKIRKVLAECRDIAMEWTMRGRIPECGKFGEIAQDLDAVCAELEREGWSHPTHRGECVNVAPQPAELCASSVSNKTACESKNENCDSQPTEPDLVKCTECGAELIQVRPGKWQHPDCSQSSWAVEPVKVPSDGDIMVEWASTPNTGDMRVDLVVFARAILARYGKGTP